MALKKVQSLDADTTISLGGYNKTTKKENPTSVEGYYLGSKQVESAKSKTGFSFLHVFQTADGNTGVWGKTNMDTQLKSVPVGTKTQVNHVGLVTLKNGNEMHRYDVLIDSEDTIEVTASNNTLENSTEDFQGEEESFLPDEVPAIRAKAPAVAATVDASRRAKVEELLKRNKNA